MYKNTNLISTILTTLFLHWDHRNIKNNLICPNALCCPIFDRVDRWSTELKISPDYKISLLYIKISISKFLSHV